MSRQLLVKSTTEECDSKGGATSYEKIMRYGRPSLFSRINSILPGSRSNR